MREIKFRAWDKDSNKMIFQHDTNGVLETNDYYFSLNEDDVVLLYYDEDYCDYLVCNAKLMQYTGLIDKNGKEIYEGDIVRHFKRDKEKLLKIEISSGYGVYAQENDTTKRLIGRSNTHLCYEVVGNIYENPELLG